MALRKGLHLYTALTPLLEVTSSCTGCLVYCMHSKMHLWGWWTGGRDVGLSPVKKNLDSPPTLSLSTGHDCCW